VGYHDPNCFAGNVMLNSIVSSCGVQPSPVSFVSVLLDMLLLPLLVLSESDDVYLVQMGMGGQYGMGGGGGMGGMNPMGQMGPGGMAPMVRQLGALSWPMHLVLVLRRLLTRLCMVIVLGIWL
jgi:hypothetical protein